MDTSTPSYLKINKCLTSIAGLWPHQPTLIKTLLFIFMIFLTISQSYLQIYGAILARFNVAMFLETIPNILVDFSVGAKVVNFFFNNHRMKKLLVILEDDWKRFKTGREVEILQEHGAKAKKMTITYLSVIYGTIAPFMIIPIVPIVFNTFAPVNGSLPKQIMYAQYEYIFNMDYYYYPVLLHSYIATFAFINDIIAIDTMCMVYVQHACAIFSIIGHNLEQIEINTSINVDIRRTKFDDKSYKQMSECIKRHKHALKYAQLIEDAHCVSYFFQLGIDMICFSFTGFQIVEKLDTAPDVSIRFAAFTSTQLAGLFLLSYPAQQLYDYSLQIYEDIYRAGWYKTSLRTRKLFVVMSMRSLIPCKLTAGKFYVLDLANFGKVVKTSLSYITVLISMK